MAWILVTPSSRGIGAALARHLLSTTPKSVPIVATTRAKNPSDTKSTILSNLKLDYDPGPRLDVQHVDLLSESSISDLAAHCKDRYHSSQTSNPHLRLSFMIPGQLHPEKSPSQINYDSALSTLQLNLLAPMMLLKHFHPFLPKKSATLDSIAGLPNAAVMAFMSARVGSITDNALGGWYSYRASKAGLNQLVKTADLNQKIVSKGNACVVGLHPGTVKTELSREFWGNVKKDKLFSPEYSADKLCEVVVNGPEKGLDEFRGACWDWKGEKVPP